MPFRNIRLTRTTLLRLAVSVVLLFAPRIPLAAQIDYRNLDDDRPVLTEDAYPAEYHAFELLLPYAYERARGGADLHAFTFELEYGVIRNGQLGFKLPVAGAPAGGNTDWGLAGLRAFGLYNLNTESRSLPALAARVDLLLPVGSLGGDATRVTLKAIATRSWGRTRFHANAAWTIGETRSLAALEPGNRWSYSLAVDRTLFRQSALLVGEVVALRPVRGAPVEVDAALGARYQWTTTTVFDLGVRRRLRQVIGPDIAVTAGFSHAFALPWLMPRGAGR
ncbi:MAG: hypothetical protein ABI587_12500 [Gemmatimonadales bacterium]